MESGFCLRLEEPVMKIYESGIFIAKILDNLTLFRSAFVDVNESQTVDDLYSMVTLELISGQMLNEL
jgi:hypothetical protein